MRRTGSEEIGSSKALGRAGMIPGLPRVLLLVIVLVRLQSGGLGSQNTTMPGALCPASSSLLCFIGWSYPQIVLYSHTYLPGVDKYLVANSAVCAGFGRLSRS